MILISRTFVGGMDHREWSKSGRRRDCSLPQEAHEQVWKALERARDSKHRRCEHGSQANLRTCLLACRPRAEGTSNYRRNGGERDDAARGYNMQRSF